MLILVELAFIVLPVLDKGYGLYFVMGVIYIGVTFWFVFGEHRWWLYQFAGIAYVMFATYFMLMQNFHQAMSGVWRHIILLCLWLVVLGVHVFVERVFPPLRSQRKTKRRDDRYFPD
jgi:hypothetical protein